MVARYLPRHDRLAVRIGGNRSFWPLTARVQHIEYEIKDLPKRLFAFKATLGDRQMRLNMCGELLFSERHRNGGHQAPRQNGLYQDNRATVYHDRARKSN